MKIKKIKNIIAYLLFKILYIFFGRVKSFDKDKILLINTGQIGDLTLSNLIINNLVGVNKKVYLLINSGYIDIFADFKGNVEIIPINIEKYRYNIFYRIYFLIKLKKFRFEKTYNITAERGAVNDELSILSAKDKFTFEQNTKFVKRVFQSSWDKYYNETFNLIIEEVDRYNYILNNLEEKKNNDLKFPVSFINENRKLDILRYLKKSTGSENKKLIVIAPFTDLENKNWNGYNSLIKELSNSANFIIVLIGSNKQKKRIESLAGNYKNVFNFAGRLSISDSMALVSVSDMFIGNDSGFTHIAISLNKKVIAIIGSGDIERFNNYPVSVNVKRITTEIECKDCQWHCKFEKIKCLEQITVKRVLKEFNELLELKKKAI